ncbi:hypothetical protein XENTR_v10000475 [Xenopus tropicalis]|nr:hypothetical protein XENTR_v10000475 [Xenopus tropicalis]
MAALYVLFFPSRRPSARNEALKEQKKAAIGGGFGA